MEHDAYKQLSTLEEPIPPNRNEAATVVDPLSINLGFRPG